MRVRDIDYIDTLLGEISYKTYENILICGISYKTFMDVKQLGIRFDKIEEFIIIYDGIRYLVLFVSERYNKIDDRVRHFISEKCGIRYY